MSELLDLTPRQITLLYGDALKAQAHDRAAFVTDLLAAVGAMNKEGAQAAKQHIESLHKLARS